MLIRLTGSPASVMLMPMTIDEIEALAATATPDTFHAQELAEYAGFACSQASPFTPTDDDSICWVPLAGGEVTQDHPETGETVPTGIVLTAAQVAERLGCLPARPWPGGATASSAPAERATGPTTGDS